MGNVLAVLLKGTQVLSMFPVALEVSLAIQKALSVSGSDYSLNIQVLQGQAVLANDTAIAEIAAWKKANGFE